MSRKMGFLEKINSIIHDERMGSNSIAGRVKIKSMIEFPEFKIAWEILFKRHPLLRATRREEGNDYFFDFNAEFSNILIKHIKTEDSDKIEQEYSRDIIKPFNVRSYLWRATLITTREEQCSYVIFGATHAICDAGSISQLLGELLRIILELRKGDSPDTASYPVPPAIDEIFDKEKFSPPKEPMKPPVTNLSFEDNASLDAICSKNLLRAIEPSDLTKLLENCRANQTTITGALVAALTFAVFEIQQQDNKKDGLDIALAVSLRPYTKKEPSDRDLTDCAHGFLFHLDLKTHDDFWELAKQARNKYSQHISEYQLPSADNHDFFNNFKKMLAEKFKQKKFNIPYNVSNIGVVDSAFKGCKGFDVESYYFTIRNNTFIGMFLCVTAVSNKLCLNFNFSFPAMSTKTATQLANLTMKHLSENI
ncbi:MAG: hypothetical protein KKE11_03155 [Gammaproteobacteria bacterium]|nr:hypothetical protein [Gammaproteobacteria bacterium]